MSAPVPFLPPTTRRARRARSLARPLIILAAVASWQEPGPCAGAAEHDPYDNAAVVRRFSFETDEDKDYDGQPDEWSRRKGPGFPPYVRIGVDRTFGHTGTRSLRFDVNGGSAICYSSPQRIDPRHTYVFEGRIRTQRLHHDAALVSVSLLDAKRRRVQRFLSAPVTGTHADWVRVRIGPLAPRDDVRFAVFGCHLLGGRPTDIAGHVWFDDLWLGKLPQLKLVSNFRTHFVQAAAPIRVTSEFGGLDPGHRYRLEQTVLDGNDEPIGLRSDLLDPDPPDAADRHDDRPYERRRIEWELPPQDYGFYRVRSRLERDGTMALEQETSFSVMDLLPARTRGEFGWTVGRPLQDVGPDELADIASQAGINWLKYPVWQSVAGGDPAAAGRTAEFFDRLVQRHIVPVGILDDPPVELRRKFARDWNGISEVFRLPPSFWAPALEPVLARYSSVVRHWQLGADSDTSFVGISDLPAALADFKSEFDRIGRDTRIGIAWDWDVPLPKRTPKVHTFFSVGHRAPLDPELLGERLTAAAPAQATRWVQIRPLRRTEADLEERGADLVLRMVAAKVAGAEGIFAVDVLDPEVGLLAPDGSPTPLFVPWRSVAASLQSAKHLGSFRFPQGSTNHVFAQDDFVTLVAWNAEPVVEKLYLGEKVVVTDIWGRRLPVRTDPETREQIFEVGPVPRLIYGCSFPIARWRLAVRFAQGQARSAVEAQREDVLGLNTFSQGVSGSVTLNLPPEWEAEPYKWNLQLGADEKFALPTFLKLPPNATLGPEKLSLDFDIVGDRPYRFRVHHVYQVGTGDIRVTVTDRRLEDGRLEIEQIIVNETEPAEVLDLACSLFVPGHKRQKQLVTRLARGEDRKFYFLPDADALRGQALWLRAEQIGGNRVLNYKWNVGAKWDEAPEATKPSADRRPPGVFPR